MKLTLFSILIFSATTLFAQPQRSIRFEVLSGPVYNFTSPLIIRQTGYPTLRIKARYRSEPFQLPPYYDFRLTLWKNDSSAWGLKFTHHKLILDNLSPPDINNFEITHGYNICSVTRM